jgi:tetratricopeptide (TPR) repeat protein
MEKSQEAFARLQRDFPDSDEARNSVPRLAKTLIEMGLRSEGVAEYKKMLETTGGKYTAGQFLMAGDALLEAKSWDVAEQAYVKVAELAASLTNSAAYLAPALLGQAKAAKGAQNYTEARQKLDAFIEKFGKSALVITAYEMLVEVASIEGSREKDDALRMNSFNTAVRALKKLRNLRAGNKTPGQLSEAEQLEMDELDLRSGEVLLRKLQAESSMNRSEAAKETRGRAIVSFQAFLMSHEPTDEHPFEKMSGAQRDHLERCFAHLLPLMAAHGSDKADILDYGNKYRKLFPNGKHKSDVETVLKPLEGN